MGTTLAPRGIRSGRLRYTTADGTLRATFANLERRRTRASETNATSEASTTSETSSDATGEGTGGIARDVFVNPCSVALGSKKRVPMRYFMKAHMLGSAERAHHHLRARRLDGLACRAAREKPW